MDTSAKLEFAVSMTCSSCVKAIKDVLSKSPQINNPVISLEKQQVVVDTTLPSEEVKKIIESTGMPAALVGMGSTLTKDHLGAAVAELRGSAIKGLVRLLQLSEDMCLIDGVIDGLTPGKHGLNIHTYGDLSNGCDSCGDHFNPYDEPHGGPRDSKRHVGDLGNIDANAAGVAQFKFTDTRLKVYDIIGRSLVIHEGEDDLGKCPKGTSAMDGNAGRGIACAIIARSAGIFQNVKRYCACDGITVWEERNVPDAGLERKQANL